jgi:hypothetical protein
MLTFSAAATPMKRCEQTRVPRARQRSAPGRSGGSRQLCRPNNWAQAGTRPHLLGREVDHRRRLALRLAVQHHVDALRACEALAAAATQAAAAARTQGAHVAARERDNRSCIPHIDAKHAHIGRPGVGSAARV